MKTKSTNSIVPKKNIVRIAIIVGLILLIPLVLTLFGSGVDGEGWHWTLSDFVVMGALFFSTGLAIDLAARKFANLIHRVIAISAIVALMLIIWAGMVHNLWERFVEGLLGLLMGLS